MDDRPAVPARVRCAFRIGCHLHVLHLDLNGVTENVFSMVRSETPPGMTAFTNTLSVCDLSPPPDSLFAPPPPASSPPSASSALRAADLQFQRLLCASALLSILLVLVLLLVLLLEAG